MAFQLPILVTPNYFMTMLPILVAILPLTAQYETLRHNYLKDHRSKFDVIFVLESYLAVFFRSNIFKKEWQSQKIEDTFSCLFLKKIFLPKIVLCIL